MPKSVHDAILKASERMFGRAPASPQLDEAIAGIHRAMPAPTRPAPPMPACKPLRPEQAERIEVLSLAPGDVLVVNCDHAVTDDQKAKIKTSFERIMPVGCKVAVLGKGMKLSAVTSKAARGPVPHIPQPSTGR